MSQPNDLTTLKTPCLILDGEKTRRNAERVSEIAARLGARLRPHIKTHKSAEIARIQTIGHDSALTVSTLAEIWGFARNGFSDFTYAVPFEPGKFPEAAELVRTGLTLNLITDDPNTPHELDALAIEAGVRFGVFLKVDCGYHRCGVLPDSAAATAIPRSLAASSNLDFAGILTHAGHSYHAATKDELRRIAAEERDTMVEFADRLRSGGIAVPTVSIGSTPTITHVDHLDGIDEIRPGNYILFDASQATLGSCGFDDCALTVLTAVVSRDRTHRKIVIDAGAIALSKDRGPVDLDAGCGFGRVLDLEGNDLGLRVDSMSQEHGIVKVENDELFDRLKVGTRLRVLANHSCLTAAQHDVYNVLEGGVITERWEIFNGW